MSIPLDVFGSRRQAGETSSPLMDVKPENLMMAAAEMHRMGRFEDLKATPSAKTQPPLQSGRGRLRG